MKRLIALTVILFSLSGCAGLTSFGNWAIGRGPDTDGPYVDQFAGFDNMPPEMQRQFINDYQQMILLHEAQWTNQILMTPRLWR